jgi:hypothetical protein
LVDEYPADDDSILRSEVCCAGALVARRMQHSRTCDIPVSPMLHAELHTH